MKTNLLILLFFCTAAFTSSAQSVSIYILELESHTKWEAVDKKWNDIRSMWVANCKAENSPEKSAQLLVQFESYVKWEAVEANWTRRRTAWVEECNQVNSNEQVADLLLEFETNFKWTAVDESWKTRRAGWIIELEGIAQATNARVPQNIAANSTFKSVTIGEQTWMAENLNVDKFRNGDPITQVATEDEWKTAMENKQPAWWYGTNSLEDYGKTYGRLYNWYAVNDPRGLAPEGWHIPGDKEWSELIAFLIKSNIPITGLKSKTGWINNKNGTNSTGFSALPGGNSGYYISYNVGQQACWWTRDVDVDGFPLIWILNENDFLMPDVNLEYSGNSVRCIRDK